jgi:hypothetical protein
MTHDDVPNEIRVVAFVGDRPLAGAWFEVELPMHRKNSYTLLFGPADERGAVTISRQQLVRSVSQVNHLFPMDYTGLQGWTREVVIKPVNRPAIDRLRRAHGTWGETDLYPPAFEEQLRLVERRLRDAPSSSCIEVHAEADPAGNVALKPCSLAVDPGR